MSQTDESVILQYIRDNYKTPEKVMSFLCVNPAECTFLTIFRSDHPELHFLTAEEIISSSKHVYATNGRNLQNTMIFIETELREYYKILFDIWICFKFAIIEYVDNQGDTKTKLERTIMDYLPSQLITLLYNPLFDIFYGAIGQFSDTTMTNRVIQENVSDIVLLYSTNIEANGNSASPDWFFLTPSFVWSPDASNLPYDPDNPKLKLSAKAGTETLANNKEAALNFAILFIIIFLIILLFN